MDFIVKKTISVLIIMLSASVASFADSTSYKASFDCSKATLEIERTICADRDLAAADVEMGSTYKELYSNLSEHDKPRLKDDQLEWLIKRNKSCRNPKTKVACILDLYHKRIDILKNWTLEEVEAQINPGIPPIKIRLVQDGVCTRLDISSNNARELKQKFKCFDYAGEIEITDINFDGYKDIMVKSFVSANIGYTYWLFDPKTNKYVLMKEHDGKENEILWNPSFDQHNRTLMTFWSGSSNSSTDVYSFIGLKKTHIKKTGSSGFSVGHI
jgi:uncharacterized protein